MTAIWKFETGAAGSSHSALEEGMPLKKVSQIVTARGPSEIVKSGKHIKLHTGFMFHVQTCFPVQCEPSYPLYSFVRLSIAMLKYFCFLIAKSLPLRLTP